MRAEQKARGEEIIAQHFPEVGAGGFCSIDGTIEFYTRIAALLEPAMCVLDFGAGRGGALANQEPTFKNRLMALKGRVRKVVACDLDPAVLTNPGADEAVVISMDAGLPFEDESFDLVLSDFVFEHVESPEAVATELTRILKPGGWICARTPNKRSLISLMTRMVRNTSHSSVLRLAQPARSSIDVFPTKFRMNTPGAIRRLFPDERFQNYSYLYEAEPSYFFNNRIAFAVMLLANRLVPHSMKSGLFVFLRKV